MLVCFIAVIWLLTENCFHLDVCKRERESYRHLSILPECLCQVLNPLRNADD